MLELQLVHSSPTSGFEPETFTNSLVLWPTCRASSIDVSNFFYLQSLKLGNATVL